MNGVTIGAIRLAALRIALHVNRSYGARAHQLVSLSTCFKSCLVVEGASDELHESEGEERREGHIRLAIESGLVLSPDGADGVCLGYHLGLDFGDRWRERMAVV